MGLVARTDLPPLLLLTPAAIAAAAPGAPGRSQTTTASLARWGSSLPHAEPRRHVLVADRCTAGFTVQRVETLSNSVKKKSIG